MIYTLLLVNVVHLNISVTWILRAYPKMQQRRLLAMSLTSVLQPFFLGSEDTFPSYSKEKTLAFPFKSLPSHFSAQHSTGSLRVRHVFFQASLSKSPNPRPWQNTISRHVSLSFDTSVGNKRCTGSMCFWKRMTSIIYVNFANSYIDTSTISTM